jgi:hypothetical protein
MRWSKRRPRRNHALKSRDDNFEVAQRLETNLYTDEVLQHYFPPSMAAISNIAAGLAPSSSSVRSQSVFVHVVIAGPAHNARPGDPFLRPRKHDELIGKPTNRPEERSNGASTAHPHCHAAAAARAVGDRQGHSDARPGE